MPSTEYIEQNLYKKNLSIDFPRPSSCTHTSLRIMYTNQ